MKNKVIFLLLGCAVVLANAQTYKCKDASGNWTAEACSNVVENRPPEVLSKTNWDWKPVVGMTAEEVREAIAVAEREYESNKKLYSSKYIRNGWFFHSQLKVNKTVYGNSVNEQWVFRPYSNRPAKYLYFTNGKLRAIQESE